MSGLRVFDTSMEPSRSAGMVSSAMLRVPASGEGMRSPLTVVELSLASVPLMMTYRPSPWSRSRLTAGIRWAASDAFLSGKRPI